MTEEFRLEMNDAVEHAFNESYKKSYENSKALLRPYKLLILEAIKSYNFFEEGYETDLLLKRTDLVGSPSNIKIYNDTYAEFNNHYGVIILTYDLTNKHRERVEPEFISKRTFNGNALKTFLKEEGIKVEFELQDFEDYGQEEKVTITFDNDVLLNLIKNTDEEIKKRERNKKRNSRWDEIR